MAGSTVPACKAAILAILTADAGLATVDKRWSPPTEAEDYSAINEKIFFGDTEILDDNWTALGRAQGAGLRRETYRLTITAGVVQEGDDPQTAEVRMWAIWNVITQALRTDLMLPSGSLLRGAGVLQFDQISALQSTGIFSPQAWIAKVDGRVTFTANTQ